MLGEEVLDRLFDWTTVFYATSIFRRPMALRSDLLLATKLADR